MKLIIRNQKEHISQEYREYQYSLIPKEKDLVHLKGNTYIVESIGWDFDNKCVTVFVR